MTRIAACVVCATITWCLATPEARRTHGPPAAGVPQMVWHRGEEGHGRPAIDGETVFFLTRDHDVLAVNAATGRTIWQQRTGEPGATTLGSALTVAGPVVVAGDYNLVAFDRRTGARRWRFVPAVGHAPGIYLGAEANGRVFAGSGAGRLYAVDADSGELVWSALLAPGAAATVFAPITDGRIVVAAYTLFTTPVTGGVGCYDAATGQLLWRKPFQTPADPLLGAGAGGNPLLLDNVVAAARGDGDIFGFDRRTGAVRWVLPSIDTVPEILRGPSGLPAAATSPDVRPLATSAGLLIAGSLKGDVVAWDMRTRRERWHFLDPSLGSVAYALSADTDSIYVPFGAGRQVALASRSGAERWRTGVNDSYFWPAASDGRRVFMGGRGGLHAVQR